MLLFVDSFLSCQKTREQQWPGIGCTPASEVGVNSAYTPPRRSIAFIPLIVNMCDRCIVLWSYRSNTDGGSDERAGVAKHRIVVWRLSGGKSLV